MLLEGPPVVRRANLEPQDLDFFDPFKPHQRLLGRPVAQSPVRPVVFLLPHVAPDALPGFFQVAVFLQRHFLLLQAVAEAFAVPVPLGVVVGSATIRDPELSNRFDEPGGSEPSSVIGG